MKTTTIKISLIATVALVLGGCTSPDDTDENTTVVVENTNNITVSNSNDIAISNDNQAIVQNSNSASRDSIDEVDESEGSEPATITDTYPSYKVAKTNGLRDVSSEFNGLTVTVTTNKSVDDVSPSSIAIYGKVGGKSTDALLKLNSNYQEGSKFVVKVYNKNNKLVAISQELDFRGESINFNIDL